MTQNTKHFTDNSYKVISAENNRQYYGGSNSFERGAIFQEKAESLEQRVDKQFKKGPPKMKAGLTSRQQDIHFKKLDEWDSKQERLDKKVSLWRMQSDAINRTITRDDEIALQQYKLVLKLWLG